MTTHKHDSTPDDSTTTATRSQDNAVSKQRISRQCGLKTTRPQNNTTSEQRNLKTTQPQNNAFSKQRVLTTTRSHNNAFSQQIVLTTTIRDTPKGFRRAAQGWPAGVARFARWRRAYPGYNGPPHTLSPSTPTGLRSPRATLLHRVHPRRRYSRSHFNDHGSFVRFWNSRMRSFNSANATACFGSSARL